MTLLPIHIAAGAVGIITGAVALYSLKGGGVHRKSGMVFVYSMVLMALTALIISMLAASRFSAMQALLTLYLVATALLAVRPKMQKIVWINICALLLAVSVFSYNVILGMEALATPKGVLDDVPAAMIFIFGGFALLGALGDLRMMLGRELGRNHRIARHLWRMCLALWIAVASFFLGQARFIPEPLRNMILLSLPVLIVTAMALYWLIRVRFTDWKPRRVPVASGPSPLPARSGSTTQSLGQ